MVFVRILLHRLIVLEPVEPGEVLTVRQPRKAGGGEINRWAMLCILVVALRLIAE